MKNPAAGGGRWVDVPPERLVSWIVTFTHRHGAGPVSGDAAGATVTFAAADGAVAECHPPFPPLRWTSEGDPAAAAEAIVAHAVAVFGDEQKASHWLKTPLALLHNLSPAQVLARGRVEEVDNILTRIEYNIPS